jgi:hypothetical protein
VLPTFVVIGAMKAGTTSLYEYLRLHPDVFMSEEKELRFFVEQGRWPRGLAWYERQFAAAGDAVAVGEASPPYTMYPELAGVPERMASVVPRAKLVYLVRDPVERIVSDYQHRIREVRDRRPPEEALLDPSYVDVSRYAFQLGQYLRFFPREQILVVPTEELGRDTLGTLARIGEFVGVGPKWTAESLRSHNVGAEVRTPRDGLLRAQAGVPGFARLRRRLRRTLPRTLKDAIKTVTHREPPPVEVPERVRRELEARLRDDVAALREQWLGPQFGGWGLLEASGSAAPTGVH